MKKLFEMNDQQHARLMAACRPVPLIMLHLGMPRSEQENANAAWAALGREMGFSEMTVEPAPGCGDRLFYAEPTETVGDGRKEGNE
jgi:hypothetical protein